MVTLAEFARVAAAEAVDAGLVATEAEACALLDRVPDALRTQLLRDWIAGRLLVDAALAVLELVMAAEGAGSTMPAPTEEPPEPAPIAAEEPGDGDASEPEEPAAELVAETASPRSQEPPPAAAPAPKAGGIPPGRLAARPARPAPPADADRAKLLERIAELTRKGLSLRAIASKLGIGRGAVHHAQVRLGLKPAASPAPPRDGKAKRPAPRKRPGKRPGKPSRAGRPQPTTHQPGAIKP